MGSPDRPLPSRYAEFRASTLVGKNAGDNDIRFLTTNLVRDNVRQKIGIGWEERAITTFRHTSHKNFTVTGGDGEYKFRQFIAPTVTGIIRVMEWNGGNRQFVLFSLGLYLKLAQESFQVAESTETQTVVDTLGDISRDYIRTSGISGSEVGEVDLLLDLFDISGGTGGARKDYIRGLKQATRSATFARLKKRRGEKPSHFE
jgi:hypothetical protein